MKIYPLFKPYVDPGAGEAVSHVLQSGYLNEGIQVTQFRERLRERLEAPRLTLTNSCTSAITLALKLAGVRVFDQVISTPMTCVATNTPIVTCGANIVWADIDPTTGMVTPESVVKAMTDSTMAVIVVAWGGTPPNLESLREVCRATGHKLILDAAHAYGARFNGEPIHRFADFTAYSFQAIKHLTTGDGGALVCDSDEDESRARRLKWFGLDRDATKDARGDWKGQQWDADIVEAGYKFNMNNVAAAIGLSNVDHVDSQLGLHRRNAAIYDSLFESSSAVRPLLRDPRALSSHWVYTVRLDTAVARLSRDRLLAQLNDDGIMAGLVHVPNDSYTAFSKYVTDLPGTRQFAETQFSLPCGWWLEEGDVALIANRVKELVGSC